MSRLWHFAIFFCYVTLASAIGVLAHRVVPGIDAVVSILLGMVVFLSCAILQEAFIRRAESEREYRRLLLLKRAFDRNREELSVARNEIRRLFEAVEGGDHDTLMSALEGLTAEARVEAERMREEPSRAEAEYEARSLLERMAARENEENTAAPPETRRKSRDAAADSDRTMREANAEVRVLHNLVEQLYAGREKPPMSLSEDSVSLRANNRREPRFGSRGRADDLTDDEDYEERSVANGGSSAGGGLGRALRGGLRVVGGARQPKAAEEPIASVEDRKLLATIREALRDDRVDLYLQPIVSLPQRKRRFYECFSRIRSSSGDILTESEYGAAARAAGLQSAIDNMLLFRCVQLLRRLRRKDFAAAFFCNIATHTLRDREFFRDFIEYMESHAELAPNLVLEFSQADIGDDLKGMAADLDRLGSLGYRFSMDGITDLHLDLDGLQARHFTYLKIDASLVLKYLQRGGQDAVEMRDLKQDLDGRGIDLIIDGIETEGTLVELLDFNIDFGQGYLFGEPRLSKEPPGGAA
ncbi:EAL domain-containing protein [Rhodospirillaceae bacterium KN72]|uniref:EAL domain-containing protein n=1 Tax=Pacificispira spongiicola TaxID=2729598 RepID=A0A7Y0E0X4_9PROT|nr:EAL domain-containing protein [Pacificispira spongiicola]NMM45207.1 EAL domain-containing protein [Pacificispira spongiicola]